MNILLVECDPVRRVAAAWRLGKAGHRVTLSSSVDEAREVLAFVEHDADAPQAVIVAEALDPIERRQLHDEVDDRFPDVRWIPWRSDLSLAWLTDWLAKTSAPVFPLAANVVRFPVERVRRAPVRRVGVGAVRGSALPVEAEFQ